MSKYKLTFTVTIEDLDDPAARQQAKGIAKAISNVVEGAEAKLQRVYTDKPPRGIPIG